MLKKSASSVLARHCRLTVLAAFTNVTRFIQRVVNLRGSPYGTEYGEPLPSLRPRWTAFLNILCVRFSLSAIQGASPFRCW